LNWLLSQFLNVIISIYAQLSALMCFHILKKYQKISNMLITGVLGKEIIKDYPELRDSVLEIQLPVYVEHYKRSTVAGHLKVFR